MSGRGHHASSPPESRGHRIDMALRGAITNARLVAAIAFAATIALAFNRGGYYPTAWGWSALAAAALLCVLVVRTSVSLSRLELLALVAFVALVGFVALSSLWGTPARGILEAQRAAMYALVLGALLAGVRRSSTEAVLVGTWLGIAVVAGYGLLTRLLPERLGVFDPVAQIRLSEPLGYWNGLGVFAAMGAVLAFGLVARGSSPIVRMAAAGSLPVLATTLYFTYSRGAWIALAIGVIAAVAADRRRLQLLAVVIPLVALSGVGPLLAYRADALNRIGAPLPDVVQEGRSLGSILLVVVFSSACVGIAILWLERRWSPTSLARRVFAVALVLVFVAALVVVSAREGSPHTLVSRAYHGFAEPPPAVRPDVSARLFSLSGNGRVTQWRVALRDFERAPITGSGAGSYEIAWNEFRPYPAKVRDAHSLYLETLSELGVIGLALLLVVIGAPLLALPRARSTPTTSAAFGAYVVFVVHSGVDWDWEMPGVTVVGLTCAAALLVAARVEPLWLVNGSRRVVALGAAGVLAALSLAGLIGNQALADADTALRKGDMSRPLIARAGTACGGPPGRRRVDASRPRRCWRAVSSRRLGGSFRRAVDAGTPSTGSSGSRLLRSTSDPRERARGHSPRRSTSIPSVRSFAPMSARPAGVRDAECRGVDPLAHPDKLIRRVYAYVAYRLGDGPGCGRRHGRCVRTRRPISSSYEPAKGEPIAWLIGIARRSLHGRVESRDGCSDTRVGRARRRRGRDGPTS